MKKVSGLARREREKTLTKRRRKRERDKSGMQSRCAVI
jgi:hypothetical protein